MKLKIEIKCELDELPEKLEQVAKMIEDTAKEHNCIDSNDTEVLFTVREHVTTL